jgi:uncharacterized protein (DUF1800 family)
VDRRAAIAHVAGKARRLAAPRSPHAGPVGPASVTLHWSAPKGRKPAKYVVLRDGKVVGHTTHRAFVDHKVKRGKTYRYTIVAVDKHGRRGKVSHALRVVIPKLPTTKLPAPSTVPPSGLAPVAAPAPVPTPAPTEPAMTTAMVDRLFWRAGFGPSQAQRDQWTGRPASELVDWMLSTGPQYVNTETPPLSGATSSIDQPILVTANDDELRMEWLYAMQTATNPFPERLAFFWHRHWAISRDDGAITVDYTLAYRERMRRYANFAAAPDASFRDFCWEMTTQDIAMSYYLDGNMNVAGRPNENYAREFMELFCLGPEGPDGVTPNYFQPDVETLAKAFTGWKLVTAPPTDPNLGTIQLFPARLDMTAKTLFGHAINPATQGNVGSVRAAIDAVLTHPSHAQFLIRKLWAEFIASPIPADTLAALSAEYRANGYKLKPLLRGILTHPLIFESLDEPNLVKPPVVYMVGVLRQLGAPMKGAVVTGALANMQQLPYRPPNVSGWEGGLSWFNTNTVQARFDAVVRSQFLKYATTTSQTSTTVYPGRTPLQDIPGETADQTYDRAYRDASAPWLSAATQGELRTYGKTLPTGTAAQRRQRYYTLQALMLGGPDGQVM